MKLQQTKCNKISIVLTMVMLFLTLPIAAAAQNGALRNMGGGNTFTGGVFVGVGALDSGALANRIYVSRISLLTGAFDGGVGVVDSCDPDAASKIKMLFDIRRNLGLTNDIAVSISEINTPEWFETVNYLRQAQARGTRIPMMELLISDSRNTQEYLAIEMKEVYITSYQTGGSGNAAAVETFQLNFAPVKFEYKPKPKEEK